MSVTVCKSVTFVIYDKLLQVYQRLHSDSSTVVYLVEVCMVSSHIQRTATLDQIIVPDNLLFTSGKNADVSEVLRQ